MQDGGNGKLIRARTEGGYGRDIGNGRERRGVRSEEDRERFVDGWERLVYKIHRC
jgi:hypothetical protein